uniref:PPUP8923 n=1 Tax=Poeciliopsis prolifica TaxID=188132 RepID=A0A0S7EQW4_9TELE
MTGGPEFKRLLPRGSMTGMILELRCGALQGPQQVACKCDCEERAAASIRARTRPRVCTHPAGCNRGDMCAQHALKSHTNRQLPATRCECVIVTLWGFVPQEHVIT